MEWLVEDNGIIIATAAILFQKFPPSYTNKSGLRGYITNMYTAPDYRGQGIAGKLLQYLSEETSKRGLNKLWLIASSMGAPVYKKFGFTVVDGYLEKTI